MKKNTTSQAELLMDHPADITPGLPGDPTAANAELIDDAPDVVKMDLRKFNRAKANVGVAIANLKKVTVVTDQAGVDKVMLLLKAVTSVENLIEKKRRDLGDPYRNQVTRINDCAKEILQEVPDAVKAAKALILAFHESEKVRLKKERTEARTKLLVEMGLTYNPEMFQYRDGTDGQLVQRFIIEGAEDATWLAVIDAIHADRLKRNEAAIQSLEAERDGADFFGDAAEAATLTEKIAAVKTIPAPPRSYGGSFAAPATKGITKRWAFKIIDASLVSRDYLQIDETKVKAAIAAGTRTIQGLEIYQEEGITIR